MILCIIPIIFSSNFWIDLCGVYVHYPRIYLVNPLFEHFSRIKIRYSLKGTIRFIFNVFFQNLNRIYSSIQNFPFLIPDKGYTEFNLQSKINITLYYPVFYSPKQSRPCHRNSYSKRSRQPKKAFTIYTIFERQICLPKTWSKE